MRTTAAARCRGDINCGGLSLVTNAADDTAIPMASYIIGNEPITLATDADTAVDVVAEHSFNVDDAGDAGDDGDDGVCLVCGDTYDDDLVGDGDASVGSL